uniref:Breast cancer anti-estrogen resistance protein 1 n=2 Tax=Callorhinchus milii TaxID=7868 RepID=A0A4W3K491_CALMI
MPLLIYLQNVLAKALYDNVAESPDELSFRKGDIMTVLERNTGGLDGWWLCSLHGRQGIVPGNRLKILVGMYDKKQSGSSQAQQQNPQSPQPYQQQNVYQMPSQSSQYTAMHPAYPQQGDNVYMMPSSNKASQNLYQVPPALQHQSNKYSIPPSKQQQQTLYQKSTSQCQLPQSMNSSQDIYQVPPSMNSSQEIYQVPSKSPPQDIYQVPPSMGTGQDIYQVPPSMNQPQDIYQVPPCLEKKNWESTKSTGKVVLPTRVGQVYVYDTAPQMEQDEYDVPPSRIPPPAAPQEIYDVLPTRGGMVLSGNQYGQEVYDTPPMAVKDPNSRDKMQDIYDVPPSVEMNQQGHQTVYDIPPSVSKDVPDGFVTEDTYDVPPSFAHRTMKKNSDLRRYPASPQNPAVQDGYPPEDVYDVPPLAGKLTDTSFNQDIYDVPPSQKILGGQKTITQDVYDFPRDLSVPNSGGKGSLNEESGGDYIYDVPPQVCRDATTEDITNSFKRLSASSTGSTRSNISTSSLDVIPVKESSNTLPKPSGRELNLDLEAAMEMLAKLQQNVESSVSYLMSFIISSWRNREHMEANVQNIQSGVEKVKNSVKDLLEFGRGAVANSTQATDRTLHTKLSKQVQKMEEVYQVLLKHSQALDNCNWALNVLVMNKQSSSDDLDRFVMYSRGIPDDTKQLASFLHGNASLLFKRTKQQPSQGDPKSNLSQSGLDSHSTNNNNISHSQTGHADKANIQARPLPSPPRYTAEEAPDTQYENNGSGWMEDYDYVHLQVKQFERLEQEVTRPIENDLSNWTPTHQYAQVKSKLSTSDRQLLLFYSEQCESNITTLINAIDAFFTSINNNQPPKIFVAHSKFVILSAHKLVFIGDTLSRQAKSQEVRNKVTHYSNLLCDMLKHIVVTTKTAALQYPSPTAAKEMVDRVTELSHCTQQFKMVISQLAGM